MDSLNIPQSNWDIKTMAEETTRVSRGVVPPTTTNRYDSVGPANGSGQPQNLPDIPGKQITGAKHAVDIRSCYRSHRSPETDFQSETMNNNNNSNARSGSGRKRRRNAGGSDPAPGAQPAQKKRKQTRQNRKRAARRGRGGAAAGAGEQAFVAAAYATAQRTGQAQIFRNGVDSCRIIHRELVASITGSTAFTVAQALALNPGLAASFPWLSNEAAGWEKYKFNALRFEFFTRTGTNVPGSMMLAPDYDASDPAPVTEVAASAYEDCEEDAPWKDICCHLKASELMGDMKERYVRLGALAANQDIKMYDCGSLFACTVDGTNVSWGKLWVEYDVTLITPHVPPGGFQASGALLAAGGSLAALTPFGAVPVASGSVILSGAATNVLTISNVQIGQIIQVVTSSTGSAISAYSQVIGAGLTAKTLQFTGAPAAATTASHVETYTVTALNPTITLTVTATNITATWVTVSVMAPNPGF